MRHFYSLTNVAVRDGIGELLQVKPDDATTHLRLMNDVAS